MDWDESQRLPAPIVSVTANGNANVPQLRPPPSHTHTHTRVCEHQTQGTSNSHTEITYPHQDHEGKRVSKGDFTRSFYVRVDREGNHGQEGGQAMEKHVKRAPFQVKRYGARHACKQGQEREGNGGTDLSTSFLAGRGQV